MRRWAATLVFLVVCLMGIGVVMLASTGLVPGKEGFLYRQLIWVAVSLSVGVIISHIDYRWWQQRFIMSAIFALSILSLAAVLIEGVGHEVGGATRWIKLGGISIQPSEFAKVGIVIVLCGWLSGVREHIRDWLPGIVLPMMGLGIVLILILSEPDFGTTALTAAVGLALMMVAGCRKLPVLGVAGLGAVSFSLLVRMDEVRYRRVMAFLDPTAPENRAAAYQLLQSLDSFVRGNVLGVGLGNSIQKQHYLPEAHTDFILAIVGEELGFIGSAAVVTGFTGIAICGLVIALRAPDMLGRMLGFGLTLLLSLQAVMNIAVVTGSMPTKGIALPFISYGGSSLLISVVCVAILVSIAKATDLAEAMAEDLEAV